MGLCQFFEIGFIDLPLSNEIGRQRIQTGSPKRICWCNHPGQSEFNENSIRRFRNTLKCEGNLGRCPLSPEQLKNI